MKKHLQAKTRRVLTAAWLLLLAGLLAGVAWSYSRPLETLVETPVYTCQQEARIDNIKVRYKPNEWFEQPDNAPGKGYLSDLAENISADVCYSFKGEREAELKGEYSVTAYLTAAMGQEGIEVFNKSYPILPTRGFSQRDRELKIKETISIPIGSYISLLRSVEDKLEFTPDEVALTVKCIVDVSAATDSGTITRQLAPAVSIPIADKYFSIAGEMKKEDLHSFTVSQTLPIPGVKSSRLVFSGASVLALLLLAAFRLLTAEEKDTLTPVEKRVRLLLKKHADRVVVGREGPQIKPETVFALDSFGDLLKLSDEVGSPIMYQTGEPLVFWVYTDSRVYRFKMEE